MGRDANGPVAEPEPSGDRPMPAAEAVLIALVLLAAMIIAALALWDELA